MTVMTKNPVARHVLLGNEPDVSRRGIETTEMYVETAICKVGGFLRITMTLPGSLKRRLYSEKVNFA